MFSLYYSAFNLTKNAFPWRENLLRGVTFAGPDGEVVVAVNKSEDDTLDLINAFAAERPTVKVVTTDHPYTDIEFDGKVKNAALQACTKDLLIQMDLDEWIDSAQRSKWEYYGKQLLMQTVDCYMVPSVDLYGDRKTIRKNHKIGTKFRLHKKGFKRGVWRGGWNGDHINTSASDTCELINDRGDLVRCVGIVPDFALQSQFASMLDDYIYTVHEGYLSLEHRVNINKAIWAEHWSLRSGHSENVETNLDNLAKEPTVYHNLKIT